ITVDRTQRAGDFIPGKQPGCGLVQHRSKEMIISLVDQRHANWSMAQSTGCGKSAETATDNDHSRQHQQRPAKSTTTRENETRDRVDFLHRKIFESAHCDPKRGYVE